ncbi:hypothetical protein GCM10022284_34100 [Streptomyces hundungensis]
MRDTGATRVQNLAAKCRFHRSRVTKVVRELAQGVLRLSRSQWPCATGVLGAGRENVEGRAGLHPRERAVGRLPRTVPTALQSLVGRPCVEETRKPQTVSHERIVMRLRVGIAAPVAGLAATAVLVLSISPAAAATDPTPPVAPPAVPSLPVTPPAVPPLPVTPPAVPPLPVTPPSLPPLPVTPPAVPPLPVTPPALPVTPPVKP